MNKEQFFFSISKEFNAIKYGLSEPFYPDPINHKKYFFYKGDFWYFYTEDRNYDTEEAKLLRKEIQNCKNFREYLREKYFSKDKHYLNNIPRKMLCPYLRRLISTLGLQSKPPNEFEYKEWLKRDAERKIIYQMYKSDFESIRRNRTFPKKKYDLVDIFRIK
jgi:hypothetical protein